MTFSFDADAALAEIRSRRSDPATPATPATVRTTEAQTVAAIATVAGPDPDAFEERAAIHEFDGGMTRPDAEDMAARAQGFDDAAAYRSAVDRWR